MMGTGTWRQWTLRDLLLAPVVVACTLSALRSETPGIIGLAIAGGGLSLALVGTAMMVAKSIQRQKRSAPEITISGPHFSLSPFLNSGAPQPISAMVARRKALAAVALAAIMFPLWIAVENELIQAATAGAWIVPPLTLALLFMLLVRTRRLSPDRVHQAPRSRE